MPRKRPKPHTVQTRDPRYIVPFYERGTGIPFVTQKVVLPLDDPKTAEEALDTLDDIWDEADPYEKQVILETLKDASIKAERLLASDIVKDPARQVRVYQTQQLYSRACTQWGARRDVS